jgi:hypothetical protein
MQVDLSEEVDITFVLEGRKFIKLSFASDVSLSYNVSIRFPARG